jgi:hypothetical protein
MNLSTFYYHLQRGYFGKRATLSASYWVNVAALFLISLGDVDVDVDFFFFITSKFGSQIFIAATGLTDVNSTILSV